MKKKKKKEIQHLLWLWREWILWQQVICWICRNSIYVVKLQFKKNKFKGKKYKKPALTLEKMKPLAIAGEYAKVPILLLMKRRVEWNWSWVSWPCSIESRLKLQQLVADVFILFLLFFFLFSKTKYILKTKKLTK